ncbi:hypothetical protein [Thalassotalea eurytherma]|uniref:Sulfotransferase family protein n=1 Tax=Thalassotalea eurytherma TaxID=1144278 RepID=A0ABQ6GZI9_9GAMM|nr:hypothetical protein [Thalassotalea eurytherma]GLX81282.1 hypothetical protein theurythT_07340 [Thalassotalea eurytherma]
MNNRTLYLHVGWSKTGTSAIQAALHSVADQLLAKGILYPKSVQWNDHSHHKFSLAFNATSGYGSEFSAEQAMAHVVNEIKQTGAHSVLLSSELSPLYFNFANFKQFVSENFDTVKVIFTVRRQSEFILSLFNQLIKDPKVRYPGTLFALSMSNMHTMSYLPRINDWAQHVGDKNIHVIPYSKTVVQDFLDIFDVAGSAPENSSVNQSIPNELIQAIKLFNGGVNNEASYQQTINQLLQASKQLEGNQANGVLFSIAEQRGLDNHFNHQNNQLAKRFLNKERLFDEKDYKPVKFIPPNILKQRMDVNK